MDDPLYGPRLKIKRAESQIEVLRRIQLDLIAQADYRVVIAELDAKRREYAPRR